MIRYGILILVAHTLIFVCWSITSVASDGLLYRTQNFSKTLQGEWMSPTDMIEESGYIGESHEVTTEDGYILTLNRIPHEKGYQKNISKVKPKKVVLLSHGLLGSSTTWFWLEEKSLPFLLADEGYDVWLWNARGSVYSRKHVNLTVDDPSYWDFSFHEQGFYDIASSIDYVLQKTKQTSLYYIGHSKGATVAYVLLSTRPEYNKKIRLLICYSPGVYVKHTKSAIMRLIYDNISTGRAKSLMIASKLYTVPALSDVKLIHALCGTSYETLKNCVRYLFMTIGEDYELLSTQSMKLAIRHMTYGASMKCVIHFLQSARTDKFAMYDSGTTQNLIKYGATIPPRYPIESIKTPIVLYYGKNDLIITETDIDRLARETTSLVGVYKVPHQKFNHLDFLWANIADVLLYKPTMKIMSKF